MKPASPVIASGYLADILDQGGALRRTLAHLSSSDTIQSFGASLRKGQYRRVVLTGMGSSFFALYPLHLRLVAQGLPSLAVETAELIHYLQELLTPGTLLVAVSQSGRSVEMVKLLDMLRPDVPCLAIVNDGVSPLALRATEAIVTAAGPEATVSCKTYVSTLMALDWLGTLLLQEDAGAGFEQLSEAAPAVEEYLATWEQYVGELVPLLVNIDHLFVTGRGASLAAAQTGGLIVKESARFPAEGMSSAAFRHGPFEMLNSRVLAIVLEGDGRTADLNRRLVHDIRSASGRAYVCGTRADAAPFCIPATSERICPFVEILPLQMVSLAFAELKGITAGQFKLATKVTTVE